MPDAWREPLGSSDARYSECEVAMKEPKSEFSRYAFGYSDKKPSVAAWLILLTMAGVALYSCVSLAP